MSPFQSVVNSKKSWYIMSALTDVAKAALVFIDGEIQNFNQHNVSIKIKDYQAGMQMAGLFLTPSWLWPWRHWYECHG